MGTTRSSARHDAVALGLGALALGGCPGVEEPGPDPQPVRIASIHAWTRVTDVDADVFAAMRPADAVCEDAGFGLEQLGLSFEVKTDLCDYVTVGQPTLAPLFAGDVLAIQGWHDVLDAPMPTQGYLGLAVDGEVLWEASFAIPGPFDVFSADVVVPGDLPEGVEMQYHVHNHGINSWSLLDIDTKVPSDP